ncbi:MAG: HAD family hydrolase [Candidatus Micrarchaeia archaeon]
MKKLIIFDIGGVIIDYHEEQYYSYLSKKTGISEAKIKSYIDNMISRMEIGALSFYDFEKSLSKHFGVSRRTLEWNKAYKKLLKVNKGVMQYMKELHHNYKIVLLSNISVGRLVIGLRYIDRSAYDHVYASCYLKMRKPSPKIYRYVLKKNRCKPEEAVFIDDRQENVDGARSVGIDSIRFENLEKLKNSLSKILSKQQYK